MAAFPLRRNWSSRLKLCQWAPTLNPSLWGGAPFCGAAPYDFQTDETMYGPYRIIEPGAAGFNAGGPYQNYYANYISEVRSLCVRRDWNFSKAVS